MIVEIMQGLINLILCCRDLILAVYSDETYIL